MRSEDFSFRIFQVSLESITGKFLNKKLCIRDGRQSFLFKNFSVPKNIPVHQT
jgi:hypothetical protein